MYVKSWKCKMSQYFISDAVRLAFSVEVVGLPYEADFAKITSDSAQERIGMISPDLISQFNNGTFQFELTSVEIFALR